MMAEDVVAARVVRAKAEDRTTGSQKLDLHETLPPPTLAHRDKTKALTQKNVINQCAEKGLITILPIGLEPMTCGS